MQQKLTRAQLIVLATLFGVSAIAVGRQMPHATAQNKLAVEPTVPERKLKYEVPAHIPLKLEVRNVEKEHWMREMEVEVTNTGDKPIYFLEFIVELPEVISPLGNITGYTLTYGSFEIMDFSTRPRVEDEPIQPGKSYTFKFPAKWAADWEWGKEKEGLADPQQLLLVFHRLNYGDGTGFLGRHGTPLPSNRPAKYRAVSKSRTQSIALPALLARAAHRM
jgi:hypothetical protein